MRLKIKNKTIEYHIWMERVLDEDSIPLLVFLPLRSHFNCVTFTLEGSIYDKLIE